MHQNIYTDVIDHIRRSKRRSVFKKAVSVMACTVMFCTTYALILPAITLEPDTFCGMEDHAHSEKCYAPVQQNILICNGDRLDIHVHSDGCYDSEGKLVCGQCDYVAHAHNDSCRNEAGELVCTLEERSVHLHGDSCYIPGETLPVVIHSHSDACNAPERGELTCTLEEQEGHTHGTACYEPSEVLLCTRLEKHVHVDTCYQLPLTCNISTDPHGHSSDCYSRGSLICGTEEGHVHGDGCRETVSICADEAEDHSHDDSCYETRTVCHIPENHSHDDNCYEIIVACGKEEGERHDHGSNCYSTEADLICAEEENHIHESDCYEPRLICTSDEFPGHAHGDECYEQLTVIVCGLNEGDPEPADPVDPVLVCTEAVAQVHVHGEGCFEIVTEDPAPICGSEADGHEHTFECYTLNCGLEEHEHSLACYSDPEADVESQATWEATLASVTLTGDRYADVVAIARTQLGYTESTRNYAVWEDNSIHGYTRYGAWYGVPYGDWCGMFASFCLRYAGVDDIPINYGVRPWIEELTALGLYYTPSDLIPIPGCLIFFDWEGDGLSDHVGIVEEVVGTDVIAIEGNSSNCVKQNTYSLHDDRIAGYSLLHKDQIPEEEESIVIDPSSTNAWAVLIESIDNTPEEPQANEVAVYDLRSTMRVSPRAGSQDPLDLTPYINSVTMYDSDKNVIPSGSTVHVGDLIEFKIEYTIDGQKLGVMNGEAITVLSDSLTYEIPKIFEIVQSDSGNIVNSSGQRVGSYVIDSETGTITMSFTEDYVEQNATGMQIHGYISFYSTVTKITDVDDEHQDYKFTDEIILGVTIQEKEDVIGDLTIDKSKVSDQGEEIIYEVTVTSKEGTKGPVTITDKMSTGLTFVEGMSVKKGDSDVNATFTSNAARDSFTLELPEMNAGDTYTVRYKCKADIDLLDEKMTVSNTATVTGKDSADVELKDEVTVDHNFDVLQKTGKRNEDGSISWTVTINQAKVDISGWVLEDSIGIGQNKLPYTEPVDILDSNGRVKWADVMLPFEFPAGSTDTYTITYTTTHDAGYGDRISNTATLKYDDNEVNVESGVGVPPGNPFTKSGKAGTVIQDENGQYLLPITWTVTIDTTNAAIPGGSYFLDILEGSIYSNARDMYMTYDQLMDALASFEAETIRITGQDVEGFSAWLYEQGNVSGKAYNILQLWANEDDCQSAKFDRFAIILDDLGIPKGNTLTFSYQSYGIFPNDVVTTETFANRFSLYGQYEVEVPVDYVTGSVKATKYAMKPFDPSTTKPGWKWNQIDWSSIESSCSYKYEDLVNSYLSWAIELSVPPGYTSTEDIVIYEDLPEGVSVKSIELPFQSSVPVDLLHLPDMTPGNTYFWDFTLYPADQYNVYHPTGAQQVSITVHVTNAGDLEITIPGNVLKVMSDYATLNGEPEHYGYLYIYTQINDDFHWPASEESSLVYVNDFGNSFTIKDEYGRVLDLGGQTQTITKDESTGAIRKEANTDSNNIITYSVVLNAYKKDLVPNSGTLNVHDELTYPSTTEDPLRARLVPGSVKLYEIRLHSDGQYEKLNEVTANYSYEETSVQNGATTTWTHTLDMTVPDSTTLLLEYSYRVTGDKNVKHEVLNTCTISGFGEGGVNGDHKLELEVKDATAMADTTGVLLYKVDANSDGIFLQNARFNIYIWNEDQGEYIIVHHPNNGDAIFTTDANGMIVLDPSTIAEEQFAYNTAYYIVEIESPNGYFLSPEPYYFQIVHEDTTNNTPCLPDNFIGHNLTSGDIIYRENTSEFTEISVEKYWQDMNGVSKTVYGEEVSSVTLELWRKLEDNSGIPEKYGTYTMTPDEDGNWSLTISELPRAIKNSNGTRGINYLYYIKEVAVNGYALDSTENNNGIVSGTIKLTNKQMEGYVLPKTGGTGTIPYTMAGLLMIMLSTAYLMYRAKARRREEY